LDFSGDKSFTLILTSWHEARVKNSENTSKIF